MTSARLPGLDMEHSYVIPGIFQDDMDDMDDPVDVFWISLDIIGCQGGHLRI